MLAHEKALSTVQGAKGDEVGPVKTAQSNLSINGLHGLYQQACRSAINASQSGNAKLAAQFDTIVRCLQGTLERRGEVI